MDYRDRAIREWDKIKDSNIFKDFEEFYAFFCKMPCGRCFKKYSAYPWSKENFYFGSYGGLQRYLKTTVEIPFYLEYKKGQRYFSFIIKDFFRNENNVIFANCICDCGNEFSREWKKILDRKIHSCGCYKGNGRGQDKNKKNTLTTLAKEIVDKYWDYDKNEIAPENIILGDNKEYWWKGEYGSYLMPASLCMKKKGGTSFPEQAILYFLSVNNTDVEHRKKILYNEKKYEIDIYIPALNVGIEYDGAYWHKEKSEKEKEKNDACFYNDIFLIRVREEGLKTTEIKNGVEIFSDGGENEISQLITRLFLELNKINSNIPKIQVTREKLLKIMPEIYSRYAGGFIEENINASWLMKFYMPNNELPAYLVNKRTNKKYWFRCSSNKILLRPGKLIEISENINFYGKKR